MALLTSELFPSILHRMFVPSSLRLSTVILVLVLFSSVIPFFPISFPTKVFDMDTVDRQWCFGLVTWLTCRAGFITLVLCVVHVLWIDAGSLAFGRF